MPRQLTPNGLAGVLSQDTKEAYLTLLDITSDDLTLDWKICNNSMDVSYGGITYFAYPFDITLPTNEQEKVSEAQLSIDNVGREIIDDLRLQSAALNVRITLVAASDVSAGEHCALWVDLKMRSVQYDALAITARLTNEDYLAEPFPKDLFTQRGFPGLFGRGVDGDYVPPPIVNAPTGYTDFSEYTIGDIALGDWTQEPSGEGIDPSTIGTNNIIADAGATGGQKLFVDIIVNNRGLYVTWDKAGDGNTTPYVLMHGWYTDGDDDVGNAIMLCVTDYDDSGDPTIDFYSVSIDHNQNLSLTLFKGGGRPDIDIINSANIAGLTGGSEYWIRGKFDAGLLYATAWIGDYSSDPGGWTYDGIADSFLTGGRIGIGSRGTSTGTRSYNFDEFAYTTDGTEPAFP